MAQTQNMKVVPPESIQLNPFSKVKDKGINKDSISMSNKFDSEGALPEISASKAVNVQSNADAQNIYSEIFNIDSIEQLSLDGSSFGTNENGITNFGAKLQSNEFMIGDKLQIREPEMLTENNQKHILSSVKFAINNQVRNITVTLQPEALGTIDISISYGRNESSLNPNAITSIKILAEKSDTLFLIESAQNELKKMLHEIVETHGSELQFGMRNGNQGDNNQDFNNNQDNAHMMKITKDAESIELGVSDGNLESESTNMLDLEV
jgi:hypothetical protein